MVLHTGYPVMVVVVVAIITKEAQVMELRELGVEDMFPDACMNFFSKKAIAADFEKIKKEFF